jgi:hypothetical protein
MEFCFVKRDKKVMMIPRDSSMYEPEVRLYDNSGRREMRVDSGSCSLMAEAVGSDPKLSPRQ